MVRAPCCEKVGLKRGQWTAEEDRTLINVVNEFGPGNWRTLSEQAGLLRCGKSCRMRWVNYLDPSIKRGYFTREEEENIIKLHEMLGNRWTAIAARLPGRTDNEIKNVWHCHLKKRVDQSKHSSPKYRQPNKPSQRNMNKNQLALPKKDKEPTSSPSQLSPQIPQKSGGSKISSFTATTTTSTSTSSAGGGQDNMVMEGFLEMDENFWSEVFSGLNSGDFVVDPLTEFQFHSPLEQVENVFGHNSSNHDLDMDFWINAVADVRWT